MNSNTEKPENNLNIIIFGAAALARSLLPFIDRTQANIIALIDERPQMQGEIIDDYPVMGLEAFDTTLYDAIFIAVEASDLTALRLMQKKIPASKLVSLNFFEAAQEASSLKLHKMENFAELCRYHVESSKFLKKCFLLDEFLQSSRFHILSQRWNTYLAFRSTSKNFIYQLTDLQRTITPCDLAGCFSQSPHAIIKNLHAIRIETTNKCAYRCFFCEAKNMKRPRGTMGDDDFAKLLTKIDGLKNFAGDLLLHHSGEPLLDSGISNKISLARMAAPKARIALNTTLGVHVADSMLDSFWQNGLNEMHISFYGFCAEQYAQIHGSSMYETAHHNLQHVLQSPIRKKMKGKVGVRLLHIEEHDGFSDKSYLKAMEEFRKSIVRHSDVATYETYLMSYAGKGIPKKRATSLPCSVAWGDFRRELNITWDWNVVPCCLDADNGVVLGNLKNTNLAEIYASQQYQDFIRAHFKDDLKKYPLCRHCERHLGNGPELALLGLWQLRKALAGKSPKLCCITGDKALINLAKADQAFTGHTFVNFSELLASKIEFVKKKFEGVEIFVLSQASAQKGYMLLTQKILEEHGIDNAKIIPLIGAGYTESFSANNFLQKYL